MSAAAATEASLWSDRLTRGAAVAAAFPSVAFEP